MALAIDGSSPALVWSLLSPTLTTATFTPPAGSILLVRWSADTDPGTTPGAPTITDNLGAHLVYTRWAWQKRTDAPGVEGQVAIWTAEIATSQAMTVSVTTGTTGHQDGSLEVDVITGQDPVTYVGAVGQAGSVSASAIAQNYVALSTSGQGFGVSCDWDAKGTQTAGSGCTIDDAGTITGNISYGYFRRTSDDDSNGGTNTLNVNLPGASTNLTWAWIELLPAGQPPNTDPPGPFLPAYLTYQLALMAMRRYTHTTDNGFPYNLIETISPPPVEVTPGPSATSATFSTQPGALILVGMSADSVTTTPPGTPTITDSLGAHLTWTLLAWQSRADTPTRDGQAALWSAVSTGAAMTVTVTNGAASNRELAIKVWFTNTPGCTVGVTGKAGSASSAVIAQSYTASATGGQVVAAVCDWDVKGRENATNAGTVIDGSANIGVAITYAFAHRPFADDVGGVANSFDVTLPGTSTNLSWVWAEILPPSGASTIPGTASLTGAGTLDAPSTQSTSATLPGAGVLTAPVVQQSATSPAGAGVLAVTVAQDVTAAPAGAGALAGVVVESVTANLAGAGVVTAPVVVSVPATITGASALTAPAVQGSSATPTGAGALTAAVTESVRAALTGAGAVTAPVVESITAALTGAGVLTASSGGTASGTATLTGAGALTAPATQAAAATLTGAGALAGAVTQVAAAALAGVGTLTAPVVESVTAAATGAGVLTATATVSGSNSAILAGAGTLTANATLRTTATFAGAGVLAVPATQNTAKSLVGAGALSAAGVIAGSASLTAAGGLLAVVVQAAVNARAGAGVLVATATVSGASCSTPRPGTGVTARPGSGTSAYALATTARPGSGITARPNTGVTADPC